MAGDMPFDEWYKAESLNKAPARGGVQSPISPGTGLMQRNPAAPGQNQSTDSKYNSDPRTQPNPWVDDVNMGENWFSPFQPVWPFGPPHINRPREWDYNVGYNLNYIPQRMELMSMLKGMARTWGVLATIIATRQDQLLRIPWTIQRRDKPKSHSVAVDEMQAFFKMPDRKLRYLQWARKLLDDLLILDAPAVYFTRDRRGRPLTAEVISGQTIFPLIDDMGRRPDSVIDVEGSYLRRQPAFQQIIKGLPIVDLDESELLYAPMRPRPEMPMFGYPATEQILVETSEAVRKTFYQLNFWTEGTIPDLIVTVPNEWTPRQIAMFQAHFDAMLSGNMALKSKVRFVPGGMKPFDIKNSSGESLWSQRDETLIRLACYAYSVSPAPFVKMMNRSVAQNAQQMAEEEGLYPLMAFWKDVIIDPIIQEKHGYDDVEAVFLPKPEPDQEKQSKIHQVQVKEGIRTRNEVRDELGLEPVKGGDVLMIEVGNAIVPLVDAAKGNALPVQGGVGTSGDPKTSTKPPAAKPNNEPLRGAPSGRVSGASRQSGITKDAGALFFKATEAEVNSAADEATGHLDDLTHLQLKTGNYKKGHVWIQGLNISIENNTGSKRGEKDRDKTLWFVVMPCPYGYIRGTIGADGDAVDVYLGKHPESEVIWVIDQNKVTPKGKIKGFDEHKVMLGYKKRKKALKDYLLTHFDGFGHERIDKVIELTVAELKDWLENGDLTSPIADQNYGKVVLTYKDLKKADTISSATNLSWYDQTTPTPRRRKARKIRREQGPRWLQLQAQVN